ncbi:MAG: hypothetical protein NVS1B10_02000 [Candidatus Saccharimonadales bacterium]
MDTATGTGKLRDIFSQTGRSLSYQKNEIILRAGDRPQGVYLIESGIIKIYTLTKQNTEHVTHFFGTGDFFPVIWLFRGHTRNVYYQALEPVKLKVVPRDVFKEYVTENQHITLELLEEMVKRYERYAGRIENLLYSDARERCAYRLLSLGNRFGTKTPDGIVINAIITHEDLARSLNMTRETFGRALSRMQSRGIITYDHEHHIVIKDLDTLVKIIGQDETRNTWPLLLTKHDFELDKD